MSLSIFDVDEMSVESINEGNIKLFAKRCGYQPSFKFRVDVGVSAKELCDNDAVINFDLESIGNGAGWKIYTNEEKNKLELTFNGWENCSAFLQALEFAVQVLREARDRVMFQKEEKAF